MQPTLSMSIRVRTLLLLYLDNLSLVGERDYAGNA